MQSFKKTYHFFWMKITVPFPLFSSPYDRLHIQLPWTATTLTAAVEAETGVAVLSRRRQRGGQRLGRQCQQQDLQHNNVQLVAEAVLLLQLQGQRHLAAWPAAKMKSVAAMGMVVVAMAAMGVVKGAMQQRRHRWICWENFYL